MWALKIAVLETQSIVNVISTHYSTSLQQLQTLLEEQFEFCRRAGLKR